MTTAILDPKLNDIAVQISSALSSGSSTSSTTYSGMTDQSAISRDSSQLAASLLSAYQSAAQLNPNKAFQTKSMTPSIQLSSKDEVLDKGFWDSMWNAVQTVGPIIVNAMNKDYKADTPNMASVIQTVPANRRNDKDWVDFTTNLLLNLAQGAVQALSGQKDFSIPANRPPMPQPPAYADKGWFDDALSFVQKAAPVALPIVMSMI
jgi:hypothetical protein